MSSEPPLLLRNQESHVHFAVYGGRLKVLDGVNFFMRSGEKVGTGGRDRLRQDDHDEGHPPRVAHAARQASPQGEIFFNGQDILKMGAERPAASPRARHLDDLSGPDGRPQPGL